MSKDKIKLVNQGLVVDTNSMMMLHDLASTDKSMNFQNIKPANQSSLTPADGIKIYLKAIEKLAALLAEASNSMDMYNKKKNISNPKIKEESKKHHYELTLTVSKMREIVEEFIQGFSVIHELDAKDFMTLLYYRFHFIQEKLEMFYLTSKMTYVADIKLVLDRLNSTFKKMLDLIDSKPKKDSDQSSSKNLATSV